MSSGVAAGVTAKPGSEPGAAPGLDALDRALVGALIADVQSSARREGRTPTPIELERGVAVRLRVTGRDRGEVDALLAPFAAKANVPGGRERIVQAVAHAFSDDTTRRLRTRKGFIDSIQALEVRTEAQLFRDLRRQAMDGFRRDLDAVWVERRMRADEAARRHARWLNLLRGLRWRTERVRLRSDLVVAILAALVETFVLWPLIARQQAAATAERRAIDEAAERASSELKRLRSEWRAHVGARASMRDGEGQANARGVVDAGSDKGADARPTPSVHPPAKVEPGGADVAERRQLVVHLALALAARGTWSDRRARDLGRLIGTDAKGLWSLMCNACQRYYGHARPTSLGPEQGATHWTAAGQGASRLRWLEVLNLMEGMARCQERNDRGDGGGDRGR